MSAVQSIHSTASSGQLLGLAAPTPSSTSRRVRVPTTVHMSRIPPRMRVQLLKSQLQPLPWQNKQICDHFITGNCPYVPCRFAHQCLLCMDDLIGACSVAQCKYVHLLSTPDAECTDDRVIIVRRGQLLPPQTPMPSGAPVYASTHVPPPQAMGGSVSTDSLDSPFSSATQSYPRLTQGYGGVSPIPKLGITESPGYGDVYHGHYPTPTGSPYPAPYSPAQSSPESEGVEHRHAYPTVASHRSTPSPQSPAQFVQHPQYSMPAQNTGYPVLGCQLPCCVGRSSYPVVPTPPSPPEAPQQQSTSAYAQNPTPPAVYQHTPYTIPTIPYPFPDAASAPVYSQPSAHATVCACPSCTRGCDASSYPLIYSEVSKYEYPPSPSSSSSGSSGSNLWIPQSYPPVSSPRQRGPYTRGTSRRTSDTSTSGSF